MRRAPADDQQQRLRYELASRVLTRDKRNRSRPLERQTLLDHNVRACFLTSGGSVNLLEQLRPWLRYWDDIESLAAAHPSPWLASVIRAGVRVFDTR